jgi:aldose 1-epimerase
MSKKMTEENERVPLHKWAPDPNQPRSMFDGFVAFGQQPIATRNAGIGERIGVVGAGDVWRKFIMPALVQRGSNVYAYDKKFEPVPEADTELQAKETDAFLELVKKARAQSRVKIITRGVDALPSDLDYVLVLTPPSQHLELIARLMRKAKGAPIAVEKPLVANKDQADKLQALLPYPLYCIDWQVIHALPLLQACGIELPFASAVNGAVTTEVHDRHAYAQFRFDLTRVTKITARLLESGDNPLGDIDVNRAHRPELFDFEKGGGMLFDMAVHPMNVLAVLGFRSTAIVEAFLGRPIRSEGHRYILGVYERFGSENGRKSGETYARAIIRMGVKGGNQQIETCIEAGKGAADDDGCLILHDETNELRWDMFPGGQIGSKLEISAGGKVIATSSLAVDRYALIMEHISAFTKSGSKDAVFFTEHAHVIGAIGDIHEHARSKTVAAGEIVRQRKINRPDIRRVKLCNGKGMSVDIINFGATIAAINVPDIMGNIDDVVLGFKDREDYRRKKHPHLGGVVGRVANRIAKGRFSLGGRNYVLAQNDGVNHLHGGNKGFDRAVWRIDSSASNCVKLSRVSPDGEEGYPGELNVRVEYALNDNNELRIRYEAQSDRNTPLNLTNHAYFNLMGEGRGTIADHFVQINAAKYTPVDAGLIPTGVVEPVDGTPLDLRRLTRIGDGFDNQADEQLVTVGKGYDHNFVLDKAGNGKLHLAARVEERQTGRVLEVETTEPGLQFYTGNSLHGSIRAKDGKSNYDRHTGFCLETQHFPDSVNRPNFPSTILVRGDTYVSETVFRFSVRNFASA